jgi:Ser/Thr protein kinase RdoA (MazF antagonist)
VGILDFGDTLVSWQINEIAIAMAYVMLGKDDPIGNDNNSDNEI